MILLRRIIYFLYLTDVDVQDIMDTIGRQQNDLIFR